MKALFVLNVVLAATNFMLYIKTGNVNSLLVAGCNTFAALVVRSNM